MSSLPGLSLRAVQEVMDSMEVGDRLRAARERAGMTIGDLAAKMGVHVATVTLWENRKNRRQMGTKHLRNAADALGIRVSELLGETEHAEPKPENQVETQLLRLFRLMPQKVQLVQLAQFVETVTISQPDNAGGHGHRQIGMSVAGAKDG
jgi:transcriptional regulator with XRE-family HTH domain